MRFVECTTGGGVFIGLLAPLAALGLLVIVLVAVATSASRSMSDRRLLYLPETLYAFMSITVVSAHSRLYSLGALMLGLMKHVA